MFPKAFEYFEPISLREAVNLLELYGTEAKILAGGHSLIPLMKLRLLSPKYVLSITRIPDLAYVKDEKNHLQIGALATHHMIETSRVLLDKCPILAETASSIGDPQVRNMGTIGGSIAHADPAGDYAPTLLALDADIVIQGGRKKRVIAAEDFLVGPFETSLMANEIISTIQVRIPPKRRSGSVYVKLERKKGDFATVGVAVQLTLDEGKACRRIGIGLGAAGPKAIRASKAEKILKGQSLDDKIIDNASFTASEESRPISDLRGSEEYKRDMVRVFTAKALKIALTRARGL